jgi:hypothetical protein
MTDPNFDRALRAAARRGRTVTACPDAATLAAYVDRGLSQAEHALVEAHVVDCSTCLERVALIAAVDAPEESAAPTPISLGALLGRWKWLVPVATVALVVAVWTRMPRQNPVAVRTPASSTPAEEGQRAPAVLDQLGEQKAQEKEARQSLSKQVGDRQQKREASKADELVSTRADRVGRIPPAQAPALRSKDREVRQYQETATVSLDKAKEGDTAASVAVAGAAHAQPVPPPPAAESTTPTMADAKQPSAPPAAAAALRKAATANAVLVAGQGILLRVETGRLERSQDNGHTWTAERVDVTDHIVVATCPIANACWVGSDAGAVLRREPTGAWVRRELPAPPAAVTGIVAGDGTHATVILADRRRYTTSDGGDTWTPVQETPTRPFFQ